MNKILIFLVFLSLSAFGLEVDEKLTTRVVKSSVSKKTVLINRGIEDGLSVGDHAKFYVSIGVVARGVVIKTSPARSVWSLYRLVNKDYIREQQVLKLKITPAVKITKDESKTFVSDDSGDRGAIRAGDPRDLGIPLAEGADDLDTSGKATDAELVGEFSSRSRSSNIIQRNIEIYGALSFNSQSQSSIDDTPGAESIDGGLNTLILRIGGEYYFKKEKSWFSRISLLAQLSLSSASSETGGEQDKTSTTEFGFGVNVHPFTKPFLAEKFIPYLNYTLSFGSTKLEFTDSNDSTQDSSLGGSLFAHSFGGGVKYYTSSGFGFRAALDFVIRQDTFEPDDNDVISTTTSTGPRFLIGASYRF